MLRLSTAWGKSVGSLIALVAMNWAAAAPVVVPNVPLSGPGNTFSALLGISGTVTANASGTALGIFPVNVPTQTRNLTLTSNPNAATSPVGTSSIGLDDVTMGDLTLQDTNIDVSNGSTLPFTLGQVVFNGTLAGSPLTITANITGTLQEISFVQAAAPVSAEGPFELPGMISARLIATIDATAASGFINLPFTQEIDSVASGETTLPGTLQTADLQPGGPFPHDVSANLSGGTNLLFEVNDSGDFEFSDPSVDVSGSFILDLDVTLSNIHYELNGTISDVIYPAGDANHDGLVSGADYTIWADHFGQGPGANVSQGDFNNDGFVTGADYTIWADNFGAGQNAMAVPEPSTWACASMAGAMALTAWRRRRKLRAGTR